MPSPSDVAALQGVLKKLGVAAGVAVATMWRNASDAQQIKAAYPVVVDPYLSAAGTITAQWYHELDAESDFAVEVAPLPAADALTASVGWAFSQADPVDALSGSVERHVFGASRDTVAHNAQREHVKYARYASATACPWCQVLATREAAYHSAESAVRGHDNCHCMAVPIRGGDTYEPPDYVQQWQQDYRDARKEVGGNLNDIVNHMRKTAQ